MFKRYAGVVSRLEELGARVGKLNNSERQELCSLLEEQAWLSATVVKKARSVLEDIDQSFERLFDWMIYNSDLIERAAGENGTPEDVLQLERMIDEAVKLRDRLWQFKLEPRADSAPDKENLTASRTLEARSEAAPAVAPVLVEVNPLPTAPKTVRRPVKKKLRKKKVNQDNKINNGRQYTPPQELLQHLAEKMTPASQRRYVNVMENGGGKSVLTNIQDMYWMDEN
jgi:hypothetical protein